MGSFLGVPIVSKGRVIGASYLTDKQRERRFTDDDQRMIEMLAARDRDRKRATVRAQPRAERARGAEPLRARDLHDSL